MMAAARPSRARLAAVGLLVGVASLGVVAVALTPEAVRRWRWRRLLAILERPEPTPEELAEVYPLVTTLWPGAFAVDGNEAPVTLQVPPHVLATTRVAGGHLVVLGGWGAPGLTAFLVGPDGRLRDRWVRPDDGLYPVGEPRVIVRRAEQAVLVETMSLLSGEGGPSAAHVVVGVVDGRIGTGEIARGAAASEGVLGERALLVDLDWLIIDSIDYPCRR